MSILFCFLIAAAIVGAIIFLCYFIAKNSWFNRSGYKDPKDEIFLSFRKFIDFYNLNPDRYRIEYDYSGDLSSLIAINKDKYGYIKYLYKIKFKLFSFIRFYYWSKNNKNMQKKNDDNEKMKGFLELVQKDIDSIRKQAEKEVREAERITNEVGRRA